MEVFVIWLYTAHIIVRRAVPAGIHSYYHNVRCPSSLVGPATGQIVASRNEDDIVDTYDIILCC